MRRLIAGLLLLAASATAARDWPQELAVRDSLRSVHPRLRSRWLAERGLDNSYYTTFRKPDSGSGLRLIGRWPWGPSWELCGRDSLLFLGSGSGVRILCITDSVRPRQLGQIACRGLVSQVAVRDSLLLVACGSFGAQVFSVADPANPHELSSIDATVLDLCVKDTLCFTVGGDSLRIYSIADPTLPARLSAVRDVNELVAVTGNYLYTAWDDTRLYDVSDPAAPAHVNTQGGKCLALFIRDTLLFRTATQPSYFSITDISDPPAPRPLGTINGYGGVGLYADGQYAYLSCTYEHQGLIVIDIGNPGSPQVRGGCDPEGSDNYDPFVPAPLSYGYIASDYGGLTIIDLHDADAPACLGQDFQAHLAVDVSIDRDLAYVACYQAGLRILDVADPRRPLTIGVYDTIRMLDAQSAVARDSFAYTCYRGDRRRFLRVLDVTDPSVPLFAAEESCFNMPQDLVLRDSFIYAAEANRFQIFNVARPRQPVLVGSCVIQGTGTDLTLVDSLAYVSSLPSPIINVSNPAAPTVVGTLPLCAYGIVVIDTFAIASDGGDSLIVYGVSNPAAPRWLSSVALSGAPQYTMDIELVGTMVYTTGSYVHVIDASDPANPRDLARWRPPYAGRRITWSAPYLYTACWDAGVCILETLPVGVSEREAQVGPLRSLRVRPNPTGREVVVSVGGIGQHDGLWTIRDVCGRIAGRGPLAAGTEQVTIDLSAEPAGVYVIELEVNGVKHRGRIVKL